jgi:hypothetical protein
MFESKVEATNLFLEEQNEENEDFDEIFSIKKPLC